MSVRAYAQFFNTKAPLFTRQYVSNHFIWSNEFGKTRRVRFGGELDIPHTGTHLSGHAESIVHSPIFGLVMCGAGSQVGIFPEFLIVGAIVWCLSVRLLER